MKWLRVFGKIKEDLPKDTYNIYIQFYDCEAGTVLCDLCTEQYGNLVHRYRDKETVNYDYTNKNNCTEAIKYKVSLADLKTDRALVLKLINMHNKKLGRVRITFENSNGVHFSEEVYIDDISVSKLFTVRKLVFRVPSRYNEKYELKLKKFTKKC